MQTQIKKSIGGLMLALSFLPILALIYGKNLEPSLKGAIEKIEKPTCSVDQWMDNSYQEQFEKYINANFGFRNRLVRINNQMAYCLNHVAKANGVIIGKENYLYEENYIKAYYGTDFIGEEKIKERLYKLKFLQDTLKKLNIDLLVVYAVGKGSYYHEYIPDRYKQSVDSTNYEYYIKQTKLLGINHIDFNDYFIKNKEKSKYPLYPQYGIHWSYYGMALATDSIVNYIKKMRNIDMPDFSWNEVELSNIPKETDYDIADGMNLVFRLPTFPMAYPKIMIEKDSTKKQPTVLTIADSFYWGIFNWGISERIFNNGRFWFYNKQIFPDSYTKTLNVSELNLQQEIEKQNVIMLMATNANLPNFGWGFIEDAYEVYFSTKTYN